MIRIIQDNYVFHLFWGEKINLTIPYEIHILINDPESKDWSQITTVTDTKVINDDLI